MPSVCESKMLAKDGQKDLSPYFLGYDAKKIGCTPIFGSHALKMVGHLEGSLILHTGPWRPVKTTVGSRVVPLTRPFPPGRIASFALRVIVLVVY